MTTTAASGIKTKSPKMTKLRDKRARGRFYTAGNPFQFSPFVHWAQHAKLSDKCVLEPFAGANNIIRTLCDMGMCQDFASFDIAPENPAVSRRDTMLHFPQGYEVCVTNPPWLARNSATRRGLPFPDCHYDDAYKYCLDLCLQNCSYVAALLPASFLQSGLFLERLQLYILLHSEMFNDTENPSCLALFGPKASGGVEIYYDNKRQGTLAQLTARVPDKKHNRQLRFNTPDGALGFISFDNTREPSIRFCDAAELGGYAIKESSRFITRIGGDFGDIRQLVLRLNDMLDDFRYDTKDILLTPFKGLRADGYYRRRMDFALARRFINAV